MDVLELASQFEKLAQQGSTVRKLPEVTVVGDPKSKVPPVAEPMEDHQTGESASGDGQMDDHRSPKEVFQQAGWNWEPRIFYTPTSENDKVILRQRGYQFIQGMGFVPPDEVAFVNQALAKGWKYAGGGFGLVPPQWFDYLKRERYI